MSFTPSKSVGTILPGTLLVHIDHLAVGYLKNKAITNAQVTMWLILLQEFHITIINRPGK